MAKKSRRLSPQQAASNLARKHDCDVVSFSGYTYREQAERFLDLVEDRRRRPKVLLVLVSPGGDAHAAYRMARCLQQKYDNFTVLIPGWCKSAGTLCILGASEIVMTDCAELGPLDVQLPEKDELGATSSGLVLVEALRAMKSQAFQMYEEYMVQIIEKSEGLISFKTATDISCRMAIGLHEPIYGKIEPLQIGETFRSMRIARAYGARLQADGKNCKTRTLDILIDSYPDHGFVIDIQEAKKLFIRVRNPNREEVALIAALGRDFRDPPDKPAQTINEYLNEPREAKDEKASSNKRSKGTRANREPRRADVRRNSGRAVEKRGTSSESTREERIRLVPQAGKR